MAVATAAGLTVTYCIRGVTQEPARRSVLLAFPLSRLYQPRQMPCCKSFHRDEFLIHLLISFSLFFHYLAAFLSSDTLTQNHACQCRVETQLSTFSFSGSFLCHFLGYLTFSLASPCCTTLTGLLIVIIKLGDIFFFFSNVKLSRS